MEKLRVRRTIIVLLSGKAGVGKTTVANLLLDYLTARYDKIRIGIFPFANRLKFVARMLGWDGIKDEKGRTLLQDLGKVGRDYDEDVWVKGTILGTIESHPYYPLDVVITDDWRFPNEEDFIKKNMLYETFKVRVECESREALKGTPQYNDVSETSLPDGGDKLYDLTIINDGSKDDLNNQIKFLWDTILHKKEENIYE